MSPIEGTGRRHAAALGRRRPAARCGSITTARVPTTPCSRSAACGPSGSCRLLATERLLEFRLMKQGELSVPLASVSAPLFFPLVRLVEDGGGSGC